MTTADVAGFAMSCVPEVGALLRTLAAGVRAGGSILELGTGAGVGLAWLVDGLGRRSDVRVTSVDTEPRMIALAHSQEWPGYVRLELADGIDVLRSGQKWNLIFADAPAGKWFGLDSTIESLADGGLVVFDDMVPPDYLAESDRARFGEIREAVIGDSRLVSVELTDGSGIILAARAER